MTDDDDLYEVEEAPPPARPADRAWGFGSTVLGAAACIGLAVGVTSWLMDVRQRDASSLPVFRAELEPTKTRPDDPGGAETPYMSIRSYEVAVGDGEVDPGETRLAAPPPVPAEEDLPMGELAAVGQGPEADEPLARASVLEALSDGEADDDAPQGAAADDAAEPTPSSEAGSDDQAPNQQAVDQAAQLAARAALSPVQIQLGAFTDKAFTESEWHRIADGNTDLLDGRALAIQSTVAGGTKYYRLRVGPFADRAEATRVCEALKARGQDCLVATNS